MANDPYEKYKKYQGGILGNSLTSGLLGNPNFLIGANIFGQGLKGQDPFSSIMPSVFQAAQIQKALTPKSNLKKAKNLTTGKDEWVSASTIQSNPKMYAPVTTGVPKLLELAGIDVDSPEGQKIIKANLARSDIGAGALGLTSATDINKAKQRADYALSGLELVSNVANLTNRSPEVFGVKGKISKFGKDLMTETEGIFKGTMSKTRNYGDGMGSGVFEMFSNPDFSGVVPLENAIAIHVARTRNPTGRLLKDMIKTAQSDAALTGLGGVTKVREKLPFIFQEFSDNARNQLALAGFDENQINERMKPYEDKFRESLSITEEVAPVVQKSKVMKKGKDGIWRFE